jgi:hypothetical protein
VDDVTYTCTGGSHAEGRTPMPLRHGRPWRDCQAEQESYHRYPTVSLQESPPVSQVRRTHMSPPKDAQQLIPRQRSITHPGTSPQKQHFMRYGGDLTSPARGELSRRGADSRVFTTTGTPGAITPSRAGSYHRYQHSCGPLQGPQTAHHSKQFDQPKRRPRACSHGTGSGSDPLSSFPILRRLAAIALRLPTAEWTQRADSD